MKRKELKAIEAEAQAILQPEIIDYHGREWYRINTIERIAA